MERRIALKNLGLAFGYTVAAPSLISIIQSCKTKEEAASWVPSFFSPEQGQVLVQLIDIILPKTDTPSASELNVHVFIDEYVDKVMEEDFQGFLKVLIEKFNMKALASASKEAVSDLTSEDLDKVLAEALGQSKEQMEANQAAIGQYMQAKAQGEEANLDLDVASATFANSLREFAVFSYKTTEYIGENVLVYQSIPGEYIGCGDLEELTGGKAYSLTF